MKYNTYYIKSYKEFRELLITISNHEKYYKQEKAKKIPINKIISVLGLTACIGLSFIKNDQTISNSQQYYQNEQEDDNYEDEICSTEQLKQIYYDRNNIKNDEAIMNSINNINDSEIVKIYENQTGITANNTNYNEYYNTWSSSSKQRKIADEWNEKGRTSNRGIATIDDKYLVAMTNTFGNVGDNVNIVLEDGTIIPCMIADAKGADASIYGHYLTLPSGKVAVDVVEWEAVVNKEEIELEEWAKKKVKYVIKI